MIRFNKRHIYEYRGNIRFANYLYLWARKPTKISVWLFYSLDVSESDYKVDFRKVSI